MFRLRGIQLPTDYSDAELALALTKVVTYTYGDRLENEGFDIAAVPSESATDAGIVIIGPTVLSVKPDATMLATDYASGKMAVIPFSDDERAFVDANASLVQRIAQLLGYAEYVKYEFVTIAEGERGRHNYTYKNYDWGTNTTNDVVGHTYVSHGSQVVGLFRPGGSAKALYTLVNTPGIGDVAAPVGVLQWSATSVYIPYAFYVTDTQNVQDAARKSVTYSAKQQDDRFDNTNAALASMAALVGSMSVFGNTVKDVTNSYNTVTQYIPRP